MDAGLGRYGIPHPCCIVPRYKSRFGFGNLVANMPKTAYLERSEVAETIDLVKLAFHQ